jgi:hypothetical protein
MVTVAAVEEPTELEATKVNWVADNAADGIPEITQVEAFTLKVAGKLPAFGEPDKIPQAVMVAPPEDKVVGEIVIICPTPPTFPVAPE